MIPGVQAPRDIGRGYTTAEVAKRVGISKDCIYHLIADGKIHATDVGTGRVEYRISPAEVERLLAARLPGRAHLRLNG